MKVWRYVIVEIHDDVDPVKSADRRHSRSGLRASFLGASGTGHQVYPGIVIAMNGRDLAAVVSAYGFTGKHFRLFSKVFPESREPL
jgi:hypothetical protein